ncbi:hypothetical protein [Robertmurraya siralis]|uniref:hypothetical protein n=1 Tax=Robertmurraya siralis TaxID=77777 RepID=UPI0010F4CCA1|nr:hypothetical protein [Robertmurraya siralis]
MRANWSEEETQLLKRIYSVKTASELSEYFPKYSNTQILRKAKQLGLKKKAEVAKQSRLQNSIIKRNDLWSDDEKKIVLENYEKIGARGVKKLLGDNRTEEQIKKIAYRLGLNREQKSIQWSAEDISQVEDKIFSIEITYKGV